MAQDRETEKWRPGPRGKGIQVGSEDRLEERRPQAGRLGGLLLHQPPDQRCWRQPRRRGMSRRIYLPDQLPFPADSWTHTRSRSMGVGQANGPQRTRLNKVKKKKKKGKKKKREKAARSHQAEKTSLDGCVKSTQIRDSGCSQGSIHVIGWLN